MTPADKKRKLSVWEKTLFFIFLLTLPLINPIVHSDGVGYYAYARSLLIDHDLRFENEWRAANPAFLLRGLDPSGNFKPEIYTSTGYIGNYFAVGPSLLWAPFLVGAHRLVLALDSLGASIPADGYSKPYLLTMALATALYGFLGLYLSFRLARDVLPECWAFLATVGIWLASSLPVYMYFNPSWVHAHAAFVVALFLWYWHRTRRGRSRLQWGIWGAISGLMLDVYYPHAVLLLLPLGESLREFEGAWRAPQRDGRALLGILANCAAFGLLLIVGFLPTLVTRWIIFGNPLTLGYGRLSDWSWSSPAFGGVLFSSNHGLLTWTPVIIPALCGLLWIRRVDAKLCGYLLAMFLAFLYLIASYPTWDGISSFGNRFFVSLTPVFVVGLGGSLCALERWLKSRRNSMILAGAVILLLCAWNLGFIFQWGTEMIPHRGAISWRAMAYNQVRVVPARILSTMSNYGRTRESLMQRVNEEEAKRSGPKAEGEKSEGREH